jgi:hypothetical protein
MTTDPAIAPTLDKDAETKEAAAVPTSIPHHPNHKATL